MIIKSTPNFDDQYRESSFLISTAAFSLVTSDTETACINAMSVKHLIQAVSMILFLFSYKELIMVRLDYVNLIFK